MPAEAQLTPEEKQILLKLARQALRSGVYGERLEPLDLQALPARLAEPGASFVTLTTIDGALRGCVGALQAYQPLAEDVREHAIAAALQDYRFPPVQPGEIDGLEIEISRLTPPQPLEYRDSSELLARLRPGIDGVIIQDGLQRATFLPQVWDKLPEPAEFLDHLCLKMGGDAHIWRYKHLEVSTYQVEEIHENG